MHKVLLISFLVIHFSLAKTYVYADSSTFNKRKFIPLAITSGVFYTSGMIGLNELWYKNNPRSSFHFFNDNHEWNQIDKIGHFYTAFHESRLTVDLLKWTGSKKKRAILWGSMAGMILQTPIEILDGFSSAWGASWGDQIANTGGSLLVLGQHLLWDELRVIPKFSFHLTSLAKQRPATLGSNFQERLLKDYNGQTYWLSGNVYSFIKNKESKFPHWLNLSIGYGAENMLYGEEPDNRAAGYTSYRQYYLSLDIDFQKIPSKNKWIKSLLYVANIIHIPAPAIEFSKKGIKGHAIYF